MSNIRASGRLGSEEVLTSVAEREILPEGYSFLTFSLLNDQNCHISINGLTYVYYRANQGININAGLFIVNSVKILENGITFNWAGDYTVRRSV
jgi:hypothetical protein